MTLYVMDFKKTDRQDCDQSHHAIAGANELASKLLDHAPYLAAYIDNDLVIRYANASYAHFHGLQIKDLIGRSMQELLSDHYLRLQTNLEKVLRGQQTEFLSQLPDAEQQIRFFEVKLNPEFDEHNSVKGFYCFINDLTESVRHERMMNLVLKHVPALIAIFDKELKFRFANPPLLNLLGMTQQELVGQPIANVIDEEAFSVAQEHLQRAVEGEYRVYENRVTRKNGVVQDVLVSPVPERNENGESTGICALLTDISQLKKTQEALQRNQLRVQSAVEGSSIGIIEYDRDNWDWVFTDHLESLLGLENGALKNSCKEVRKRIHPDDLGTNDDARSCESRGVDTNVDMRLKTNSGEYRWFNVVTRHKPANKSGTSSNRLIGIISDVNELKTAQLELEIDVKRRDEYLAMLSHELRNPMAAISFSLSCLKSVPTAEHEKAAQLLDVVERQTKHMSRLLQDLLEVSRVTRNRIDFDFEYHDFAQSVRDIVLSIEPAIQRKHQTLTFECVGESLMVFGDIVRLKQAMNNLLDNASKYTAEQGQIDVSAGIKDEKVFFSISDNGFGIDEQSKAKIFDMFYQGDQPLHRKQGGMGVGLFLVHQTMLAHGGSINVTSDGEGYGSEFIFYLPRSEMKNDAPAAKEDFDFAGQTVVLVEDSDDSRNALKELLQQRGCSVIDFASGDLFVDQIDSISFDIGIFDIGLPGRNGFELAAEIRKKKNLQHVPLVAMTGYDMTSDRAAIRKSGFDCHIVKPISIDDLCAVVAQALSTPK